MKVLLVPMGTPGDVQPFIDLGRALRGRGHEAVLVANDYFRAWAADAGLGFEPLGTRAEYLALLDNANLWRLIEAPRVFARRLVLPTMRPLYDMIAAHHAAGPIVVAAQTLALGARLAEEKLGVPTAMIHRQPASLRSYADSTRGPWLLMGDHVPRVIKAAQFAVIDRLVARHYDGPVNAFQAELGLPALKHVAVAGVNSPRCTVGLWDDWFAAPQPDWPASLKLVGFNVQQYGERPPAPELEKFVAAGAPPVFFTMGSGMRHGAAFYAASAAACALVGCRGVLVTRFAEQIPANLPENVFHADYAPYSWLMARSAAVVHHGGIGTVAQGLAAGVPQIIVAGLVFDTVDHAHRLRKLGVGASIPLKRYNAPRAARLIRAVLDDAALRERARAIAPRVVVGRAETATIDLLEALHRDR